MDVKKILVVEDESDLREVLKYRLEKHGFEVLCADGGKEGLDKALAHKPDLLVLDLMMPGFCGEEVCRQIRSNEDIKQPAIIMLTAKTDQDDIIAGVTLGADDYIGKPFSVRELVLRAEAVLRRSDKVKLLERILHIGEAIEIDTADLSGTRSDRSPPQLLEFTRREIEMLRFLKNNADRPVSREELLEEVWGYDRAAWMETRTVDIHIAKLRRKIEPDPKNPTLLVTVRGEGYQLRG